MKIWDSFITREDLESEPGVVDQDKVRALTLNTYLMNIRDFIELGGNEYAFVASEHFETVMMEIFMCQTEVLEGRVPELDEIRAYLKEPENVEARKRWTDLCVHANKDNWPDFEKRFREEWSIPEEVEIKDEERHRLLLEKARAENGKWKIKELAVDTDQAD